MILALMVAKNTRILQSDPVEIEEVHIVLNMFYSNINFFLKTQILLEITSPNG